MHMQLDSAADDPDYVELFDFLIGVGVGSNTYFDDLIEFAGLYVDSKFRQLRFAAFAVADKMPDKFPLTQIAIIKRAYGKKPCTGFRQNPDSEWTTVTGALLKCWSKCCGSFTQRAKTTART